MPANTEYFCFNDIDTILSGPGWEDPNGNPKTSASESNGYLGRPRLLLGRRNYLAPHWERRWKEALARDQSGSTGEGNDGEESRTTPPGPSDELARIAGEIINEVRALFTRWLRMQNLCILAGAGCSKCVGGPLGEDLYQRCKQVLKANRLASRTKGFHADLLESLRNTGARPNHPFDFEEFLSLLSAARRCMEGGKGSFREGFSLRPVTYPRGRRFDLDRLDELIDGLEKAIAVVCNLPLSAEGELLDPACPPEKLAHLTFISKILSRDPTLGRIRLATTNYDTLFEQALDRLGVFYADGFTGTVDRHFYPGSFVVDMYYPGEVAEGRVRRYDRFLHLYKLHGSITWRRTVASATDPFGISCDTSRLPNAADVSDGSLPLRRVLTDSMTNKHLGLGILPTSTKYGETLAMPFSHLFRAFGHSLLEPQTVCLVLGYSGWDEHLNRLIEDALSTPSFTLVIIDPGTKPKKWAASMLTSDRCDRVYWFGGDWARFERAIHELFPDVEQIKTERDVARQMREIQRSRTSSGPLSTEEEKG